jgi:phosphoribosylformylglycinamidine cyclo-ligase
VVAGMSRACRENHCALLGGETAEMPGFYADGEYDIAGFIVGVVERSRLITGATITPGDVLIGVPSTGLHTNGYSLARRIAFEHLNLEVDSYVPELNRTIGEALLEPHRSYLALIRPLLATGLIKGMAHITGGGITENLPRVLPNGTAARIRTSAWTIPPVFSWLQQKGRVPPEDMLRTFNMGIGLVVAVAPDQAERVKTTLGGSIIGEIIVGERSVTYL